MYTPTHPRADNSTYSNIDYVTNTHKHLDWENVTFFNGEANATQIMGSVSHDFNVIMATDIIVLDVWNLNIINVTSISPGSAKLATDKAMRHAELEG